MFINGAGWLTAYSLGAAAALLQSGLLHVAGNGQSFAH
jgi:hypothetical protein